MTKISPPDTDDTVEVRGNSDGTKGGMYGQEHDSHDHRMPRRVGVGQQDAGVGIDPVGRATGDADLPPDAGRRAHVDQRTGAVQGSGAGAGGGAAHEDFDQDAAGGG